MSDKNVRRIQKFIYTSGFIATVFYCFEETMPIGWLNHMIHSTVIIDLFLPF